MSDHLPEDVTRWPESPHEVLAVKPDVGRRELRSAYVQLIRKYKPELFPEQFRRIRAAYEMMLQFIEWSEQAQQHERPAAQPAGDAAGMPPAAASAGDGMGEARRMFEGFAPAAGLPDDLKQLWQQACDGQAGEAYAALRRLDEQHPRHEDICLRGYWLLTALSQLDAQRVPRDWLARGLRAGQGRGPLVELYRREIELDPREATTERYAAVANLELSRAQLVALTEFRWLAAARERKWDIIKEDLATLRPQFVDTPDWWARLLYEACGHLAWEQIDGPSGMFRLCCREINQMYDPLQSWSGALDQIDFLEELAAEWRKLCHEKDTPEVCALVPICWSRPAWEIKAQFDPFIARLARNAQSGLEVLDYLARESPKVLAQLGSRLIDLMRWESIDVNGEFDRERHASRARDFFTERANVGTYPWLRPHLLNFCLLEGIPPGQLAALATEYPLQTITSDGVNLAQSLFQDEPIRFVYLAYELFWK